MLKEVIVEKLDIEGLLSPTITSSTIGTTISMADLGCSVGPNTITSMQQIMDIISSKCKALSLIQPQFQVLFNDHVGNDFNTLFLSLPPNRSYFAAGVPGSYHGRLFPNSSLHIIHSSYALHWLSKAPTELLDEKSPTWNGGRIHYGSAPQAVVEAYVHQHAKDMESFLNARAQELVVGGMMMLIMPCVPDRAIPHSMVPVGITIDLLGACLLDMVESELVREEQVNSFNVPIYSVSPREIEDLIQKNGRFSIARMELTNPNSVMMAGGLHSFVNTMRAVMEGVFAKHFGNELMDELFNRFSRKIIESSDRYKSSHKEGTLLFISLIKQR